MLALPAVVTLALALYHPRPELSRFAAELQATASLMVAPGKGILAADESSTTIGKRFAQLGVENTQANRRAYRELLFSAPGLQHFISGAICYEETLFDTTADGADKLIDILKQKHIIPGIKVDTGVVPLFGTHGETVTQGLDDLGNRCAKYYAAGARFAKWRAVLSMSDETTGMPSELAISQNAVTLARYAAICQMHGLVPIVEPEVLMDGTHTLAQAQAATEKVLAAVYKELNHHNVFLEGTLLKPNMVRQGEASVEKRPTPAAVALASVTCLRRTVPPAVAGICFLSGGMSEEEATFTLNEINKLEGKKPWPLTFSFGRALQQSCLKVWQGKKENALAAKKELLVRAKANSLATLGEYAGEAAHGAAAAASSFVPEYVY